MPNSKIAHTRSPSPLPKRKSRQLVPQAFDLSQYGPWDEQRAIADLLEKLRSRYPMSYRGRGAPAIRREMLFNVSERVADRIRNLKLPATQGRVIQLFKEELKKDGHLVGHGLDMTDKVVRDYVKRIRLQQKPLGRWTRTDWIWIAKYSREDRSEAIKILKKLLTDDEKDLKKFCHMRTESPNAILPPVLLLLEKACRLRIAATRDVLSSISS